MTTEISIIVPVYNVEKYLRRCVDSILAQTFRNFECILIDDGSPDNCPAICDEYAAKDPRIQVIHQKNAGVSAARNAGLAAARGNWIGFVDSDDWIEPETYEIAYNTAKEKNADLVQWGMQKEENGKNRKYPSLKKGYFSVTDDDTYFSSSMCHKLILKKLICDNNITYPLGIRVAEDEFFAFQCYVSAVHCYHLENAFYHYEQRKSSAMHNISTEILLERVQVIKLMQDLVRAKDLENSDWKKILLKKKKEAKLQSVILLKKPDFNLYYSLFPECNKIMPTTKGKKKIVFLLLYFHLNFITVILVSIWKSLKGCK